MKKFSEKWFLKYLESLDFMEPWMYEDFEDPEGTFYAKGHVKTTKIYQYFLDRIKYGKGNGIYWKLSEFSNIKKKGISMIRSEAGKHTKAEIPSKQRGISIPNEELEKRALLKNYVGKNARRTLKERKKKENS